MSTPLLPQAFWFRMKVPCRKVEGLPRSSPEKPWLDLPAACSLPEFARLEGRSSTAAVRVAWNPGGLAVAVEMEAGPVSYNPAQPETSNGLELWIDTRDSRDNHRATKFCHRFLVALAPASRGHDLRAILTQRPIARALANAPTAPAGSIQVRAGKTPRGWRLDLFLSAAALHGFDPETNRRLGFFYRVGDPDGQDQYLTVGREFPIGEDPSLWASLELRD